MAQFHIHFFSRKKVVKLTLIRSFNFFDDIEGIKTEMDEQSVRFLYTHPRLGHQAKFLITPKSQVPDIYRLSPRYLDLNFHLEMPLLTPNYVADKLFDIVKKNMSTI